MRVRDKRLQLCIRSSRVLLMRLGSHVKRETVIGGEIYSRLTVTDLYNRILENLAAAEMLLKPRTPRPKKSCARCSSTRRV